MAEHAHPELPTADSHDTHEERKSSLLTDILTIIGFAILFIIIIWGIIHLVELIASSFSSNGSKPQATIQVSAPAEVVSGQPVTISWNYQAPSNGSYAFLYQCQSGLSFQMSTAKDSNIPCGVAYSIGNASSTVAGKTGSITLIPMLTSTSSVRDTVSLVFIPSQSGSQVQGTATMTIDPVSKTVTQVKTTQPSSSVVKTRGTSYGGPADLSVRIISAYVDQTGTGIVTFDIANIGGSTSDAYTFSAQLPTAQSYPYVSPFQAPLAPGSHVTSTLRFTDVASGGGLFSVSILDGRDANPSDDYASTQLSAPYQQYGPTGYNNYNNYQPGPYIQYPNNTY
ncbi:MAG: hypothetical protein P4L81_03235 [Candidatus Pacebacteria bacterium]|nr:hypothetical protein [Candidatus Paceibacterota bacterium]